MPTPYEQRFAKRLPWISMINAGSATIPPYSCVMAQEWVYPDISDGLNVDQPPYLKVVQPSGSFALSAIFITDGTPTAANMTGGCARPIEFPQLIALDVSSNPNDTPYQTTIGPVAGSWKMSRSASGFQMVCLPQTVDGTGYVGCVVYPSASS